MSFTDLVEKPECAIESQKAAWSTRSTPSLNPLGHTIALESNLLGVPIGVLHPSSAKKSKSLNYSWKTESGVYEYKFERISDEDAFPIPQHTRFFDILIALFAQNWNADGMLYFRFSDILSVIGTKESQGSRTSIYETIRRFQRCNATWQNSWDGRVTTWSSPLIVGSSVFDNKGTLKKNPRRSLDEKNWHCIKFCEPIVMALRDQNKRIFFKSMYSCGLTPESYIVYRYFFKFNDRSHVIRDIDKLLSVFPWNSTQKKFLVWMNERLSEAKSKNFVEDYEINTKFISVKCSPIGEIDPTIEINKDASSTPHLLSIDKKGNLIAKKNKRKSDRKDMKTSQLTYEDCLAEYQSRLDQGQIDPFDQEIVSLLFAQFNKDRSDEKRKKNLMTNLRSILQKDAPQKRSGSRKQL
jgi:hypothetical protein